MNGIKFDQKNARIRNEVAKSAILESLKRLGAGRSIVIDREGVIIAGNGVYEQAQALGIPVRVIDSDGSVLIAVKRTDLATDDAQRIGLAVADNQTAQLAEWDETILAELRASIGDFDAATGFITHKTDWGSPPPEDTDGQDDETISKKDTQLILGDMRIGVSREDYHRVVEGIRQRVGFEPLIVVAEMKRMIGLEGGAA